MKKEQSRLSNHYESVEKYFKEIVESAPLDPAEEIELARSARKGDSVALDKLVRANLRFVISIAKEYRGCGLPFEDLISEGNWGLVKAAQRFDETRGFKFISYAVWWIRQSILQALAEQPRAVRLPMSRVGAIQKVAKMREKLQKQYKRDPSLHEVADRLKMTDTRVAEVLETSARHLSLDAAFKREDGNGLLDVIENQRDAAPDDFLLKESLEEDINEVLFSLEPREAEVIRLYFGLTGERSRNLEEIGTCLNLTRERVRQIKEKALRRMRRDTRSRSLKKHLG